MGEGRRLHMEQSSVCAVSGGVGVAGTLGRATTDKTGRAEPMSREQSKPQSVAQAGSSGEAAGVGPAVGVLRSSEEVPVMGMERRRGTCPGVRGDRGRRPRKGISRYAEKASPLTETQAARLRRNRTRKAGYGKPVRPV